MDRGPWWATVHDVTKLDTTEMIEYTVGSIHLMWGVLCSLSSGS